MIVVSDTSPLNYLLLIGLIDVLPQLYGRVVMPQAVYHELRNPAAPRQLGAYGILSPLGPGGMGESIAPATLDLIVKSP